MGFAIRITPLVDRFADKIRDCRKIPEQAWNQADFQAFRISNQDIKGLKVFFLVIQIDVPVLRVKTIGAKTNERNIVLCQGFKSFAIRCVRQVRGMPFYSEFTLKDGVVIDPDALKRLPVLIKLPVLHSQPRGIGSAAHESRRRRNNEYRISKKFDDIAPHLIIQLKHSRFLFHYLKFLFHYLKFLFHYLKFLFHYLKFYFHYSAASSPRLKPLFNTLTTSSI